MKVSKVIQSPLISGQRKLVVNHQQEKHMNDDETDTVELQKQHASEQTAQVAESDDSELVFSLKQHIHALEQEKAQLQQRHQELEQALEQLNSQQNDMAKNGYQEGFDQGKSDALAENKELQSSLSEAAKKLDGWRDEQIHGLQSVVTEVALSLWSKLVGEAYSNPDFVKSLTQNALRQIGQTNVIKIFVNQKDYDQLTAVAGDLLEGSASIELAVDKRIKFGGCLIETDTGMLDARLESQVQILKDNLVSLSTSKSNSDETTYS